jgi:hypothetical protein
VITWKARRDCVANERTYLGRFGQVDLLDVDHFLTFGTSLVGQCRAHRRPTLILRAGQLQFYQLLSDVDKLIKTCRGINNKPKNCSMATIPRIYWVIVIIIGSGAFDSMIFPTSYSQCASTPDAIIKEFSRVHDSREKKRILKMLLRMI